MARDKYRTSPDPQKCSHPNQSGRLLPTGREWPRTKLPVYKTLVTCNDCGTQWESEES